MLNLQSVNRRAMHGSSQGTSTLQIDSVNFERVVGSLGSDVLSTTSSWDWSTEADEAQDEPNEMSPATEMSHSAASDHERSNDVPVSSGEAHA